MISRLINELNIVTTMRICFTITKIKKKNHTQIGQVSNKGKKLSCCCSLSAKKISSLLSYILPFYLPKTIIHVYVLKH